MATLAEFNRQEMNSMLARAKTMSTAQLQKEVSELEAEKQVDISIRIIIIIIPTTTATLDATIFVAPVPFSSHK
jgi:hypothetical protein